MKFPRIQAAVLESLPPGEPRTAADIAEALSEQETAVTRAAYKLAEDGLLRIEERESESIELTEEGETYRSAGLPEIRLYRAAREADPSGHSEEQSTSGIIERSSVSSQASPDDSRAKPGDGVSMGDLIANSELDGQEVEIALSNFARKGYGTIENGSVQATPESDPDSDPEAAALAAIATDEADSVVKNDLDALERRGLIVREERTVRSVTLTEEGESLIAEGIEIACDTVGQLTPDLLTSGEWKDAEFASYNVAADAETIHGGRKHVLRRLADQVKSVLVGMGFQEMEGPHADADFWINDALFMPQDHPARTHWDRFALSHPERIDDLPEELIERVRRAHLDGVGEDGEGYHSPWDEEFARQLALRGHTTSLSMRYLSGHAVGELEPPERYFSVEKVYRNDTLDATHLLEFFQIEGWVMAEELSVRDLMGTFTEFYEQFGITDIRFKPHYNPYTEPSFELFGRHPVTDELIEIGNSGLFRPEVLEPLGVECDVMAWGLALERLGMLTTGAEDIRDLHGTLGDLEFSRTAEVTH